MFLQTKGVKKMIKWIVVKSTKKNRQILESRGLYSSDSQMMFDFYETIMNEENIEYTSDDISNQYFLNMLDDLGITY